MKQQLNINKSRPKKSLGQNFIIDDEFSRKLGKSINSDKDTNIIEIGPGKGALTSYLLEKEFKSIVLIEKDRELYQNLYKSFKNDKRIEVKNIDALHVKYEKLKLEGKVIIVGNLPFNVSTQLLFKWLDTKQWPPFYNRMVLMFQKEVADRIKSGKNSKNYGKISVACQARCEINELMTAPPEIFYPVPKVHGTVLDFQPSLQYKNIDFVKLKKILSLGFSKRRKKIKTSLKDYKKELMDLKIDENLRAEDLSVKEFCKLSMCS